MTTNRGVEFFDKYSKLFVSIARHMQNRPENMPDKQISVVQKTVSKLIALNYAAPHFIYEEDILAVYWRKNNFYLSIELEDSGVHNWAATDGNQFYSGTWISSIEALPETAVNILGKITD